MRYFIPLLLLATACDEADFDDLESFDDEAFEPELLPSDELPPPPVVTQIGTCPGPVTFQLSGVTPGGGWSLWASPQLAPGMPIPSGPCTGLPLRIGPPARQATRGMASRRGTASVSFTLGAGACGWYVQPVDIATCTTGMFHQIF